MGLNRRITEGGPLTSKEVADLQLAAWGYHKEEVGQLRGVSYNMVAYNLGHVYRKLATTGIAHSVAIGVREGYIILPGVDTTLPTLDKRIERASLWAEAMSDLVRKALIEKKIES
jgi:DNA-binding CsgD family transcriptional regulator